ncbi:MAG TPA: DUF5668 domain-containing protein [Bacteroidia bacterium]|nr:DUF5668 domain-containing protein [Bacteroidia bacterium]
MEIQDSKETQDWEKCREDWQKRHRRGKIFGGFILVIAGSLLLARQAGVIFPEWLFTWKMLLIVLGFFVGVKHSFRRASWFILMLIGGAFMFNDFYPGLNIGHMLWPVVFIVAGLFMIFRPRGGFHRHDHERWERKFRHKWSRYQMHHQDIGLGESSEDALEASVVFGSIKKNIISKDFKGGEVNCVFGGAVINLTQADINGKAVLEVNCVFGGAKLIVPQHWQVQAGELVTVMGGIDDKRPQQGASANTDKILVLKGSAVFGGIEILN